MQFRQEIETLRGTEAAERRRVEQDEKRLEELEDKLKRLESQSQKLGKTANTLEIDDTKFRNATDQRLQELPTQVAAKTSQPDFQSELSRYLGTHQFRLTGAAGEPSFTTSRPRRTPFRWSSSRCFCNRLNDWILFQGTIQATLIRAA